ncbi:MAG: histidine kinase dimerization/phospho-acceptor domain-containing protein, partial [Pseudoflavonifractor sp.]
MKEWRKSTGLKITALVLALIFGVAGFWSSYVTLANWDDLWSAQGYFSSSHCYNAMERRQNQVRRLVSLRQEEVWSGSATYLQRQEMAQLRTQLSADKTNFRFVLRDAGNGALLDGNIPGDDLASQVVSFTSSTLELYSGIPEGAPDDSAEKSAIFVIEYGVAPQLPVADEFSEGQTDYAKTRQWLPAAGLCALLCDGLLLLLLVLLCSAAGHRRGRDDICLTPLDRIPTDLFAGLAVALFALLISAGEGITWAFQQGITPRVLVGMALISLAVGWLVVRVLLSVCVRVKVHRFWRSCLLWRLCAKVWQGCKTIFDNWSMTGRAVLLFCLYLAGSILTGFTLIFFLPYQCIVLYALCRWVIQWRAICSGTAAILGGDADYKIPTDHMYPDLERHAAQLNDLGSAVGSAVDQRMKSERFKAELITNVSHDLKTPLTSIINYVDLLKKIPLENSTADEYIEVLD